MTRVVVIGGGISGLSTAWLLGERARAMGKTLDIRLLEQEGRAGGKIRSVREDGFLCEWGPNGFLDNKPQTLDLCVGLGITDRLHKSNDNARKRYIFTGGELHRLPENGPSFLKSRLLSWPGKLRLLAEPFAAPPPVGVDETLAAFGRRRLGDEALRKLIAPMASGIFAGDPETMSLASCFPRIAELEREYGGLFKAMVALARKKKQERAEGKVSSSAAGPGGTLTSFREGIQFLTDTLAAQLGERLVTGCTVSRVEWNGSAWIIKTSDGMLFSADLVIMAAPAYAAATMLEALDQPLADLLRAIPYATLNVICCGFETRGLGHQLDGFGFLVPKEEGRTVLGTLWDSSMFEERAPQGRALLRSMAGGACRPELLALPEEQLLQLVRDDLRVSMGISAVPCFSRVIRHGRAIPQYVAGHGQRLEAIEERAGRHRGLLLTGNAFRGVGLNDCVASSQAVVERALAQL
ncbi:protoporphyrinogen oxidase [Trichlorobacter ammonificans]|uniref:Coproporphyrinogen III oxidase n=1 Tax=Trichlorobacter ammonificans TaxID=2916410 RepID=A0ABN8HQU4_9BACT|nr:protoporphyrinogen oxidase [Trichlorobacter ammonificans]CAH2032365.1 Coproporphyrinogen III oxidase [Trichlorobacter ammonificans]